MGFGTRSTFFSIGNLFSQTDKNVTVDNSYSDEYADIAYDEIIDYSGEVESNSWFSGALDFFGEVGATITVGATSVVSGVMDLGESIVDGVVTVGGTVAAGVTSIFDEELSESIKEGTMDFVSYDATGELNRYFYEETEIGRAINDASALKYDSELAQGIQTGTKVVVEAAAATAIIVATGGTAAPALAGFAGSAVATGATVTTTGMLLAGTVGFLEGVGAKSEELFQNETDTSNFYSNIGLAGLNGVGKALSWIAMGRTGASVFQAGQLVKSFGVKATLSTLKQTVLSLKNLSLKDIVSSEFFKATLSNTFKDPDFYLDSLGVAADNLTDAYSTWQQTGEFNLDYRQMLAEIGFAGLANLGAGSVSAMFDVSSSKVGNILTADVDNRPLAISDSDTDGPREGFLFGRNKQTTPIQPETCSMYNARIANLNKSYNYNGIILKSDTDDGLQRLYNYLSYIKQNDTTVNAQYFLNYLGSKNMIMTDVNINGRTGGAFQWGNVVFFDVKTLDNFNDGTFFHEAGHFVDSLTDNYRVGQNYFGMATNGMVDVPNLDRFQRDYIKVEQAVVEQFTRSGELDLRVRSEIARLYPDFDLLSASDKNMIYNSIDNQMFHQLKDHYMRESGYAAVSDIYDALTGGNLRDSGFYGHGANYYSDFSSKATETFANFSDLYNLSKTELLDEYFPSSFRVNLTQGYEEMTNISVIRTNLDKCKAWQDGKYGNGAFIDGLIEYVRTGDINQITRDGNARAYVESLNILELKKYLISSSEINTVLDKARLAHDGKYGFCTFGNSLIAYLNTGDIKRITREGNARFIVENISVDQIKLYLRNIGFTIW